MSFDISPTGAWLCCDTEPHSFDEPLASAILELVRDWGDTTLVDVGCGSGQYVKFLRRYGVPAIGIDGNPNTPHFSEYCGVADFTEAGSIPKSECVLCLEVGEHIPEEHEEMFLRSLSEAAERDLILSWFPNDGEGIGHVNPRSNDYIKSKLSDFTFDEVATEKLRESATLWWFRISVMVFHKKIT